MRATPAQILELAAYILLGCYFLCLVNLVRRSILQGRAKAACRQCLAYVRNFRRQADNPLETQVRMLVTRNCVKRVQGFCNLLVHVIAIFISYCIIKIFLKWISPMQAEQFQLEHYDMYNKLLVFAVCSVFFAFPDTVTAYTVDLAYVSFSVWWCVHVWLPVDPAMLALLSTSVYVQRVTFGLIVCNTRICCVCNLLIMSSNCVAFHVRTNEGSLHFIVQEVFNTVVILIALFFFEEWSWAGWRHVLEIKASSRADATVRRLLSALCDAVFILGPDLRITERAPKLANLLLQHNSACALEGAQILDFMSSADQERFRSFVTRPPIWASSTTDPELAQALNVNMRDSNGTGVQVQLFHSHFRNLNDEVGHLIGVCEIGRAANTVCRPTARTPASAETNGPQDTPNRGNSCDSASTRSLTDEETDSSALGDSVSVIAERQVGRVDSFKSRSSPAGNLNGLAQPLRSNAEAAPVTITFDVLRFIIRHQWSRTPVVDANVLERESLLKWVVEWDSCRAWAQDFVNAALRPTNAATWPKCAGPPCSVAFKVAFRGYCPLPADILSRKPIPSAPSTPHEGSAESSDAHNPNRGGAPPVRLVVSEVHASTRPKQKSSTRSNSSSHGGTRKAKPSHHLRTPVPPVGVAPVALGYPSSSL